MNTNDVRVYFIDSDELNKLRAVMLRLFTENRMNGDDMRDAAQVIQSVIESVKNGGAM